MINLPVYSMYLCIFDRTYPILPYRPNTRQRALPIVRRKCLRLLVLSSLLVLPVRFLRLHSRCDCATSNDRTSLSHQALPCFHQSLLSLAESGFVRGDGGMKRGVQGQLRTMLQASAITHE